MPAPCPSGHRQPIDAEGSAWHLEGSGAQRLLVLDLEKKQAGLEWNSLVPVAASDGGVGALV